MDFGAVGNAIVDDGPAISAAFAYAKAIAVANGQNNYGYADITIEFPTNKIYNIVTTINATGLRFMGLKVRGGQLFGATNGTPVIDAMGSALISWQDMVIVGASTAALPNVGLQIGRVADLKGAQQQNFFNVIFRGSIPFRHSTTLPLKSLGFLGRYFQNAYASPTAYVLVQDGANSFGITSAYTTVSSTVNTGQSFNENIFSSCQWQQSSAAGGPAILYFRCDPASIFLLCIRGQYGCNLDMSDNSAG